MSLTWRSDASRGAIRPLKRVDQRESLDAPTSADAVRRAVAQTGQQPVGWVELFTRPNDPGRRGMPAIATTRLICHGWDEPDGVVFWSPAADNLGGTAGSIHANSTRISESQTRRTVVPRT
jgi:hypothetical protein